MDVFLWIVQGLLAVAFLMAGMMKIARSKSQLASNMGWVEEYSDNAIKGIGAAEVLAAIGLVVPPLTDIAPILAPLAALGLVVVMAMAAMLHRRRGETQMFVPTGVLGVLALVVVIGRFFIEPF